MTNNELDEAIRRADASLQAGEGDGETLGEPWENG